MEPGSGVIYPCKTLYNDEQRLKKLKKKKKINSKQKLLVLNVVMQKCFTDGQRIRHTINNKTWMGA